MPKIVLPYPDKKLNPNTPAHHMVRHRAKKAAKAQAYWCVHEQMSAAARDAVAASEGAIAVKLGFYPATARSRDLDNAIASMKAALDGIAQALGVDDSRFTLDCTMHAAEKPGRVEVFVG